MRNVCRGSIRNACILLAGTLLAALYSTHAFAQTAKPIVEPLSLMDIGFLPADAFDLGDGLPAINVVSAAVTPQGQVWLGTRRGLARYNSRRFVPEAGPNGIFNSVMGDLAATPDGKLWASAPRHGVHLRSGGLWRDVGKSHGLADGDVIRLRSFGQRKDYRLFATGRGFVQEWDGRRWQSWALPAPLATLEIFDVLLQPGNQRDEDVLWIASFGQGLWRCRGREACASVVPSLPGPRFNEITSLEQWIDPEDGSPILWVASYGGGLARLQRGEWKRYFAEGSGLRSNYLQRLLSVSVPGQPPHLWVGSRSGLAHLVGDHWVPLDATARFDGATVKVLAAGRNARGTPLVWIGSDQGAARLPLAGPWQTISQTGRRGNGVWSVLQEVQNGVEQFWIGSDGEGLLHYSSKGWTHYGAANGLPADMVRSIARDPVDGALLVGTWGGDLARFDGRRFHVVQTPWPKSDEEAITIMLPDRDDVLWFALREGGLVRRQAGKWKRFDPKDGYPSRIYDLQRIGNTLWASTNGQGLARIDDSGWKYFARDSGFPDDTYLAINLIPASNGRQVLWIGSLDSGIVRVDVTDPAKPTLVTSPSLPVATDRFVYAAVPDRHGNLFVSSNYGASFWRASANGHGYVATDFYRGDGLPHDESNYNALQVDARNRIWLGTLGGVGVFTPPAPGTTTIAAPLVLEGVEVDGKALPASHLGREIELDPGIHDLQVQMALRTGERESGIRYRSQLQGLESAPTGWSGDNQRSFTALPAGKYMMRIEARDADGIEAKPLEMAISIPLPFWRTLPALTLLAAALLVLLVAMVRLRERQQRRREQQLVGLVRQRTSELETRGLELRRINEELTRLSYHDPLTDLANRRMLLERLHGEWELGQARGTDVAFLLFDLDQFKSYNDLRGHLAGDDCLREVGRRIDAQVTSPDATAGRYGGEEFGVVLPGCTLAQAMTVAEHIRHAIEKADLAHPGTPQGVVTISVGVASMIPRAGFNAELLIAAADAALYRAKGAGKNRVEAAR